jgi:hypothetical protein
VIVWLASYPRSGNTLLRQVLRQCLGLGSFEQPGRGDRVEENEDGAAWAEIRAAYGDLTSAHARAAFLTLAGESSGNVLIKTHDLPEDDTDEDRAIYVVRDGRLALRSYVKFQKTYQGGAGSFVELLLGDHAYADWTTHYRLWCERRRGPTLVVRFEELVAAGSDLLGQLADFLGHRGEVCPWANPQDRLRQLSPSFFGPGSPTWRPDDFWTAERLRQFYTLHGPLSVQLGYCDEATAAGGAYPAGSAEEQVLQWAWRSLEPRRELQRVCDERELALRLLRLACDEQEAEVERLRAACDERLALIGRLERTCQEREQGMFLMRDEHAEQVAHLRRLCEEHLEIIGRLEREVAPWRKLRGWLPRKKAVGCRP